jgi:hypothetical protein
MPKPACPQDSDDTDEDPEHIKNGVGAIPFQDGTPREHHGIDRIEDPNKEKWACRSKPTHQAEAENAHHHSHHFDEDDVLADNGIVMGKAHKHAGMTRHSERVIRSQARDGLDHQTEIHPLQMRLRAIRMQHRTAEKFVQEFGCRG